MNMPEVRCFLCLDDGKVLKLPPGDSQIETVIDNPHRYCEIEAIPSRIQYQWLDDFIKHIPDEDIRIRMEAAINGKGAFRRFKDILLSLPEERRRWFEYRDQMMRQHILNWVHKHEIEPENSPPWEILGEAYSMSVDDDIGPRPAPSLIYNRSQTAAAPYANNSFVPTTTTGNLVLGTTGNGASVIPMRPHVGSALALNRQHLVEELREYLIEWCDHTLPKEANISPIKLEELAFELAKRFPLSIN
jgi:hypothetical protein